MSGRATDLPTTVYDAGSRSFALGSTLTSKRLSPTSWPKRMPAPPDFSRTSPSTVSNSAAGVFARAATIAISVSRAVAAACRIWMPPRMMPLLPAVGPWSGVSAVSPSIMTMRSTPMPSSSAAICGMAMRNP